MVEYDAIVTITADFDKEKAPFDDFNDIAGMMAELIKEDFIVDGVKIKGSRTFVRALKKLCQSCESFPATITFDTQDAIYHICNNCIVELVNTSLTPQHFRNILKNGHSTEEFYLHDDFYDDEGNALQPL